MRRFLVISVLSLGLMAQSGVPDLLSQARDHYNRQQYDEAIRVAGEAQVVDTIRPAATVVLARALLERYRQTTQASDLERARAALRSVDASALNARDRVDLTIALGTSLYVDQSYAFDDRFMAAAEQFELALSHAGLLDRSERDQLFDWWAVSLDRQAQQGSEESRGPIYVRILTRAEDILANDSYSTAGAYWLAAAARGVGDLTRAIGAAVAGWVRAATMGERGQSLRIDLDRLMRQVILPERAREMVPDGDARAALELLEQQWTQVKETWSK